MLKCLIEANMLKLTNQIYIERHQIWCNSGIRFSGHVTLSSRSALSILKEFNVSEVGITVERIPVKPWRNIYLT